MFASDEFHSAMLLAELPARTAPACAFGKRQAGHPMAHTMVDLYVDTVVDAEWKTAPALPPVPPALMTTLMEELYTRGVTSGPVSARDLGKCASCPPGPSHTAALLAALNGFLPKSLLDPMTLGLARAREDAIRQRPLGWGTEGPCASVDAAHYAAFLLLKSTGFPTRVLPVPKKIPGVGRAFKRLAAQMGW